MLPFQLAVPTGTVTVTFSQVTGAVSYGLKKTNGPDGSSRIGMNISACGGISGIKDAHDYFYLVGVFLDRKPANKFRLRHSTSLMITRFNHFPRGTWTGLLRWRRTERHWDR